jgi:Ice-binding-like
MLRRNQILARKRSFIVKNNPANEHSEVKCGAVNRSKRVSALLMGAALALCLTASNLAAQAPAPLAPVDLGSASTYAVLGASTVTNTGPSVINGDLGVWPGTAFVPGTPPAAVNGTIHALGDIAAQHAQASLAIAYNDAAGRTAGVVGVAGDLGGRTLAPGLYKSTSTLAITGDLTLDANGDPNAVFIFQVGSGLTVATGGRVVLSGGAKAANVFWQVGSSATLGTYSALKGTVMAYASITIATGATLDGRALAQHAAVTLDTNAVTKQN